MKRLNALDAGDTDADKMVAFGAVRFLDDVDLVEGRRA